MNYILSFAIIILLGFLIVKNVIGVVNKIKERKANKDNAIDSPIDVQKSIVDDIDNKENK